MWGRSSLLCWQAEDCLIRAIFLLCRLWVLFEREFIISSSIYTYIQSTADRSLNSSTKEQMSNHNLATATLTSAEFLHMLKRCVWGCSKSDAQPLISLESSNRALLPRPRGTSLTNQISLCVSRLKKASFTTTVADPPCSISV